MMREFTIDDVCLGEAEVGRRLAMYNRDDRLETIRRQVWDRVGPAVTMAIEAHYRAALTDPRRLGLAAMLVPSAELERFITAFAASASYCYSGTVNARWVREIALAGTRISAMRGPTEMVWPGPSTNRVSVAAFIVSMTTSHWLPYSAAGRVKSMAS